MIFPKKHLPLEKSLLCLGAELIPLMRRRPIAIDSLWADYAKSSDKGYHTYNDMVLTLDFLFAIGVIALSPNGEVCLS